MGFRESIDECLECFSSEVPTEVCRQPPVAKAASHPLLTASMNEQLVTNTVEDQLSRSEAIIAYV